MRETTTKNDDAKWFNDLQGYTVHQGRVIVTVAIEDTYGRLSLKASTTWIVTGVPLQTINLQTKG